MSPSLVLLLAVAVQAGPVLTLDEAVKTARDHQPQVRQARAAVDAAAARSDEARAALLPSIGASGTYQKSTANVVARPGVGSSGTSGTLYDSWNLGASASLLVWDFGGAPGRWRAAREGAQAQRETGRATEQQVVLGARTAYFVARAARDLVTVARETLTNQEAHLRQTEGFVQVGTHAEIDLAQARTDRANAQVQLITAEANYETAKAQLNQAMGVERTTEYEIGDDRLPPVDMEDAAINPLLDEALRARPESAAFEALVRQQEATLGASRSAYWPTLGISTGLSEGGPTLNDLTWNWNAQATASWNLFAGGLTSAQVREAEATLESVRAQRDAFRLQVRLDLEQARLAVRSAKSKLVAAGEALDNARQRLRLAEGRYQTGAGSIIELGDSQVALNAAAAQQVGADFDLATARARLLVALARPLTGSDQGLGAEVATPADDQRIASTLRRTIRGLDGLRGLAIGGVLACHFLEAWPGQGPLDRAAIATLGLGWAGVDLFFVLSGFLITGILVDTLGAGGWWRAFLARRTLRIFPLYYLALAIYWLVGPPLGLIDPWTLGRWGWWYWTYLGNWAFAAQQVIPGLSHFWSLAVEEQFYLVWPLVVRAAGRRRLAAVALALVAAGPALRWAIVALSGWPVGTAFRATPGRLDQLALGALLAVLLRSPTWRRRVASGWPAAVGAGTLGFGGLALASGGVDMHHPLLEVWSHTALGLAFVGLVAGAVVVEGTGRPLARALAARPLQVLGRYSYGLYVIHYFVHVAALQALRGWPPGAAVLATRGGATLYVLAGVALSLGLAMASWHLFERRFLALKSRFVARPVAAPA